MELTVIDTETASLKGGVCDIAIAVLDDNLNVKYEVESLVDPECPISASASGVHHIVDDMIWESPTLAEFMELNGYPLKREGLVVSGHNVDFDIRMLGEQLPAHRKVCTLRLARNLWPDLDDHKLQTLRYHFRLDAGTAHRAMGDVVTCISLLRSIAEWKGLDIEGLIRLAALPLSLETRITFGKHRGEKLKALPNSYVRWLLDKADIEDDLREALEARA